MVLIWVLGAVALALVLFFAGARTVGGGNRVRTGPARADGRHGRDMGANVNPSQQGNEVDLWPDRTGSRTRRELGARNPVDMSFVGGVEEPPSDQPPTQWHPQDHGVPGDHVVNGHHRSATAPERQSTAKDPYAHAPVPGPNHIPPTDGVSFPDEIRP